MGINDLAHNCKAKTTAVGLATMEHLKYVVLRLTWNAWAVIGHDDLHISFAAMGPGLG